MIRTEKGGIRGMENRDVRVLAALSLALLLLLSGRMSAEAADSRSGYRWGAWHFLQGQWMREAIPPDWARETVPPLVDVEGRWYRRDVGRARVEAKEPPFWYPSNARTAPDPHFAGSAGDDRSYAWAGAWRRIDGLWVRAIRAPGRDRPGRSLFVDPGGRVHSRVSASNARLVDFPTPSWFPGLPEGWEFDPSASGTGLRRIR
jgi:hypothetical protein